MGSEWWFLALTTTLWVMFCNAQVLWTPIFIDGQNQIDMWTAKPTGCKCQFDPSRQDCACCVHEGGCPCGYSSPNRCAQCGIEQHCNNMCNVTLEARTLLLKSGKSYGQIKSPSLEGPTFCWYKLIPDAGQRVEIQIYRLVSVGHFNGTNCVSGYVQLVDGMETTPRPGDTHICGDNARYSPPVVLFGDKGPAVLLLNIQENTPRSQLLAYFSFTAANSSQGVAFQPKGGRRLEYTDCDWLYQDFSCREPGSCRLASPGYPGLYSPNRHCNYHITTSSIHTKVRIKFLSLYLPHNQCGTDHVNIYQGSMTTSPLIKTVCGNKKQELVCSGPNLLLEFSSGTSLPPYDYNGFLATLEFWDDVVTTTDTIMVASSKATDSAVMMDGLMPTTAKPQCEVVFTGNQSRSGHFDSRTQSWHQNCTLTFIGKESEIVHVSLFNYRLRAPSCQTVIEVYAGLNVGLKGGKPLKRICSPSIKHARDPSGKFLDHQTFVSKDNTLTIVLRRYLPTNSQAEVEYMDGAFIFHDEHVEGTLKPDTLCSVDYYGLSSPKKGHVGNPGGEHVFWNVDGPLQCVHRFSPAANQSVSIHVTSLTKMSTDPHCHTECGDGGCRCVTTQGSLSQIDHLLFVTDTGLTLSCLCGDYQAEYLPVGIRSWTGIRLLYSVAHYSWTMKGFGFSADYKFIGDNICGHHIHTHHSGAVEIGNLTETGQLNNYFYQSCTWLLDSHVERQLNLQIASNQNRPCTAWNISVYEYAEHTVDHLGVQLHTFCPREKHVNYSLPFKLNVVIIRLTAMTAIPPEFQLKWGSQIVRANTRIAGPTSVATSSGTVSDVQRTCFKTLSLILLSTLYHICR